MLDKNDIRSETNSRAYSRGLDLYFGNNVVSYNVQKEDGVEYIESTIKGSGKKFYKVTLDISDKEYIDNYSCECPAFHAYSGMCKHCVAIALDYIDRAKQQKAIDDYLSKKTESVRKLQSIQKGIKLETTPDIKSLMTQYSDRKMLPVLESAKYGKISLKPTLSINDTDMTLEFKIGNEKMYVLKDVIGLADKIDKRATFSYGKKLKFKHIPEAFSEESQELVKFVCRWVENNRQYYTAPVFNYSNYYMSTSKVRNMSMTMNELEQFIDAMKYQKFVANIEDMGEREWQVTDDKLDYKVYISGTDKGVTIKTADIFGKKCTSKYIFFKDGLIYKVGLEQLTPVIDFIDCMKSIPNHKGFVEKKDLPEFCNNLLPRLKENVSCEVADFDESKYAIEKPEFKIYFDMPQKDFITCKAIAVYGDKEYSVYDKVDITLRDILAERTICNEIEKYSNAYDEKNMQMVLGEDQNLEYLLLTEGIANLQNVAEVYVSDALKRIQIVSAPKATVGVSVSGDLLELKVTTENITMEELVELVSRYSRKKKFYKLKDGNFINATDDEFARLKELKDTLQLTDKELKKKTIKVPKYRALYLDEQLTDNEGLDADKSESFVEFVKNIKTIEESEFTIPKGLEDVLREYQKQGFKWIESLYHNGFGGILADDMGLGKTLQIISFLLSEMNDAEESDNKRTLIICPASLVYNWKSEIEKFAPEISVCMITGNADERQKAVENSGERDVLITSYDLVRRDILNYEKIEFFCEIIDEAQYIKNSATQAARAVKVIKSGFRMALTGTPVENSLSELWSIFDYLMPGFLYNYKRFKQEIEQPIALDDDQKALYRLQQLISPFVLRRLKKEVLKDLPDKLEENMYVQMQGEQQKLYDAHVKRMKLILEKTSDEEFKTSKIQILAELTKLRQMCCDPSILFENYKGESAKTEMCINLIKNAVASGHKILLFSQFTTMLDNLQKQMKKEKISFYTLTGRTKKEKRIELVDAFNNDDTSVFCISLKAGGTGLNLTAADIVIHYDPWWNVAVQNQATDRAHRIGQENTVNVYKLITKDTIEENIVKLQERKMELADKVLTSDGIGLTKFDKQELLGLLR